MKGAICLYEDPYPHIRVCEKIEQVEKRLVHNVRLYQYIPIHYTVQKRGPINPDTYDIHTRT